MLNLSQGLNASQLHGEPTNQWFYPSRSWYANESGKKQVAYLFHSVPGSSKIGTFFLIQMEFLSILALSQP